MRLLLVEDDPVLGAQLHKQLGKAGYAADWVQAYTFQDGKVIQAEIFMDTKLIADAFIQ